MATVVSTHRSASNIPPTSREMKNETNPPPLSLLRNDMMGNSAVSFQLSIILFQVTDTDHSDRGLKLGAGPGVG